MLMAVWTVTLLLLLLWSGLCWANGCRVRRSG